MPTPLTPQRTEGGQKLLRFYCCQNCSRCGEKVEKTLSTRTDSCPHCGHIQDRDWNAAINILKKALEFVASSTVGHTGINDSGESDLCVAQETVKRKSSRRKSKPKS